MGTYCDLGTLFITANYEWVSRITKWTTSRYICKELNPQLDQAIMEFVEHQVQRNHEIVEDVLYLIDEEECSMAEYVEVPKVCT